MKFFHTPMALAAILGGNALATNADAGELYGKISVGQTQAAVEGIDLSDGLAYGAALGTSLGPFRVEAGIDRLSGDFANVIDANALDYSATAYIDVPVGSSSSAFAGIGLDYIDGEAKFYGSSMDASGQGWHWAVGAAHRFSENLVGEVQFRQINADLDSGFGSIDLDAQEVTAGLRFLL